MATDSMRAPFPWTGGKSDIADDIWSYLGADVAHYIEPFGGSLAVLLARPNIGSVETVNDNDHYLINFWRALQGSPSEVAHHASNPQSEADLYARNKALVETSADFRGRFLGDPEFYDAKLAGWWAWGQSTIIGRGFANDICQKMPILLPAGVNSLSLRGDLGSRLQLLAQRMRGVRVLCGDWKRCLGPTAIGLNPSRRIQTAGIFLDPPYSLGDYRYAGGEPSGSADVWEEVKDWAFSHGHHSHLRIVLAGYDDVSIEHPEGWHVVRWKGHGGLGRKSGGSNENRNKETLWVSPHCLSSEIYALAPWELFCD